MTNLIKWSIDQAHSRISFKVRHLMIAHVRGGFVNFEASIYTTDKDFTTAEVDLSIDVISLASGDPKRDAHLLSEEFFDVSQFKQINFTSRTMSKTPKEGQFEIWGELTIKGITHNVKLLATYGGVSKDPYGQEKAGFQVTGVIKRSDWGLTWNAPLEAGGLLISDEVMIDCEIELLNEGLKNQTMVLEPQNAKKVNV